MPVVGGSAALSSITRAEDGSRQILTLGRKKQTPYQTASRFGASPSPSIDTEEAISFVETQHGQGYVLFGSFE